MIGLCKTEENFFFKCFAPLTKSRNGSLYPYNFFLLHYDNIMKLPAKFEQCSTIESVSIR